MKSHPLAELVERRGDPIYPSVKPVSMGAQLSIGGTNGDEGPSIHQRIDELNACLTSRVERLSNL